MLEESPVAPPAPVVLGVPPVVVPLPLSTPAEVTALLLLVVDEPVVPEVAAVLDRPAPVEAGFPAVVMPVVVEVTPSVPGVPSASGASAPHPSRTPRTRQQLVVVAYGDLLLERC